MARISRSWVMSMCCFGTCCMRFLSFTPTSTFCTRASFSLLSCRLIRKYHALFIFNQYNNVLIVPFWLWTHS